MIGYEPKIEAKQITHPDAYHAAMKELVSPQEGWEGYVMRVVEVTEFGYTPKHQHSWPHINYMLEGEGELMIDGVIKHVKKGSFAYVPGNTLHQFRNVGKCTFKFICIVPEEGHK